MSKFFGFLFSIIVASFFLFMFIPYPYSAILGFAVVTTLLVSILEKVCERK